MRIAIFTVCRNATVQNGRLNIFEAYGGLFVPQVPVRAQFTIATRMLFSAEEEGPFSAVLTLIDPDGKEVSQSPIDLNVPIPQDDVTGLYADSIGSFSVMIRSFGEYQFQFVQKGKDSIVFPFYVTKQMSI
jgi:hypothetical protein